MPARTTLLRLRRRCGSRPSVRVTTQPSIAATGVVGSTLSSLAQPGTYVWPSGPVTETWAWFVDGVSQPGTYVIAPGDTLLDATVTLSATGLPAGTTVACAQTPVANTPPVAGGGGMTVDVGVGTSTVPAAMAAPSVAAVGATRMSVTPAAAPADGGTPITGYEARISTDGGTTWGAAQAITGPAVASTYGGFTPGAANHVAQTRAVNSVGAGAWSPSSSAVTMGVIQFLGYWRGTNITSVANSPLTVDLTAAILTDTGGIGGALQADDVLVALAVNTTSNLIGVPTINSTGWTKQGGDGSVGSSNARTINAVVGTRAAGSTPPTSFDASGPAISGSASLGLVLAFRNVDPATPLDALLTMAKGNGGALADPPSITPTAAGAYVLAFGAATGGTAITSQNAPTGGTLLGRGNPAGTSRGTRAAVAKMPWTSGAIDATTFSATDTGTSDAWVAYAAALKPY